MADAQASQLKSLKDGLKIWERQFAATHDGKKPSREDIKANPDIAARYKLYSSLTKQANPTKPSEEQSTPSKISKPRQQARNTPQKRKATSHTFTPQRRNAQADESNHVDGENLSSPKQPAFTIIGPTPNKDGRVIGLFDCIPSATPSNRQRSTLGEIACNIAQTPTRRPEQPRMPLSASPAKLSRTPQSSGKRFMLDAFVATPSKRLRLESETPISSKQLLTPSRAQRHTGGMPSAAEEASPMKVQPFKRRSFGRSLSSMIRDMKQQQEKDMDAELELLHEIETGGDGACRGGGGAGTGAEEAQGAGNRAEKVAETQFEEFDEDAMAALEDLEREERGPAPEVAKADAEQPQKVWKKKGLKRQTKRVIMRPVRRKPTSAVRAEGTLETAAEDSEDSGAEARGSDGEDWTSDVDGPVPPQPVSKATPAVPKPPAKGRKAAGTINPNATAHANFRSLKIKNKNSKAKGRGRFGRGR